jgi:hypothetical protein
MSTTETHLIEWVNKQPGAVQSWEKVEHTFISEETGEMYCAKCKASEFTVANRSRSFLRFLDQGKVFERFTERHLHGVEVA